MDTHIDGHGHDSSLTPFGSPVICQAAPIALQNSSETDVNAHRSLSGRRGSAVGVAKGGGGGLVVCNMLLGGCLNDRQWQ